MLETFVEQNRFAATCYRAAGWKRVGATIGAAAMPPPGPVDSSKGRVSQGAGRPLAGDFGRRSRPPCWATTSTPASLSAGKPCSTVFTFSSSASPTPHTTLYNYMADGLYDAGIEDRSLHPIGLNASPPWEWCAHELR